MNGTYKTALFLAIGFFIALAITSVASAQEAPMPSKPLGGPEFSLGYSVLGPDIVGFQLRKRLARPVDFEFGAGYRHTISWVHDEVDLTDPKTRNVHTYKTNDVTYDVGLLAAPGFIFWVNQNESGNKGPNRHGIFVKLGWNMGTVQEGMVALGYSYERFKNRKHVYSFDAGLMLIALSPASHDNIIKRVYGSTVKGQVDFNKKIIPIDNPEEAVVSNMPNLLYIKWSWRWPI